MDRVPAGDFAAGRCLTLAVGETLIVEGDGGTRDAAREAAMLEGDLDKPARGGVSRLAPRVFVRALPTSSLRLPVGCCHAELLDLRRVLVLTEPMAFVSRPARAAAEWAPFVMLSLRFICV